MGRGLNRFNGFQPNYPFQSVSSVKSVSYLSVYNHIQSKNLFFITGRGRSGTWLLQSILDTHPEICVTPEALFIIHLYGKYINTKKWTAERKNAFVRHLFSEEKIIDWWQSTPEAIHDLLEKYPPESRFSELCKAIYYEYVQRNDKENAHLLGDKNPEYSLYIKQLAQLYPKSKFIHLVRDPRANVLSYQNVDFDVNDVAALAHRWAKYSEHILDWQREFPDRILVIHYEDLLTNTQVTLEQICAFLGVDFMPSLLEFYKYPKNIFGWNKKITEPIDPKKATAWQGKIKPEDEACIFKIAGKVAADFGYTTTLKPKLTVKNRFGLLFSMFIFFLEKFLFKLPLKWRAAILHVYRRRTKVL